MITVTVTGEKWKPSIAKIIADTLTASRYIVRFYPDGAPKEGIPDGSQVVISDETKEKPA